MESAGEDLDNIFDEHESRENNEDGRAAENIGESNNENSAGIKIQPPKRVVKNPRLKFNPERLIGERGIPVLVEHFKDVKFKGKGHEKEDLDKLLSKLEHWTHRLFPSMKFEDCLHQIEKLGTKRPVQTCLRKIRLDMPILASDFVKDDEEDDVQRNEDTEPVETDAFDQLLGENFRSNPITTDEDMGGFNPLPNYSPPQRNPLSESRGQVLGSSTSSLTDEQKERLERNRMLAVERRKAKLAALEQNSSEQAKENSQCVTREDPIQLSFDSLLENKESNSTDIHECNSQSIVYEKSILNNVDSDNLGLDDLMDLVDEEAVDTNAVSSVPNHEEVVTNAVSSVPNHEEAVDTNAVSSAPNHEEAVDTNAVSSIPNHDQTDLELTYKKTDNISANTNEANSMEINTSSLEKTQSCIATDITLENEAVHNNNISAVDEENLQLESLIDLVNEGEDYQNSSSLNHTEDIEAMDYKDGSS